MCWNIVTLLDRDAVTHRLRDLQRSLMDGGSGVGPNHSCVVGSSMEDAGISISICLSLTKVVGSGANSSVSRTVVTEDRGVLGDCDGGGGGDIGGDHLGVMAHHVPGVDGLGGGLLTGGGDDLLAVLGDGGVHDLIILLVTNLPRGLNLARHTLELGH